MVDVTHVHVVWSVRCCQIAGSRGHQSCSLADWQSMASAGWSNLQPNRFMTGLFRITTEDLSAIRKAQQCSYWGF